MEFEHIRKFRAERNWVIGVIETGKEGYAKEELICVCNCCKLPDCTAEEVARQIAQLLERNRHEQI